MAKWSRYREGYADSTAGIAIQKVSREERKISMRKKRELLDKRLEGDVDV